MSEIKEYYQVKVVKRWLDAEGVQREQDVLESTAPGPETAFLLESLAGRLNSGQPVGTPEKKGFAKFLAEVNKGVQQAREKAAAEGQPDPLKTAMENFIKGMREASEKSAAERAARNANRPGTPRTPR